MECKLLSNLVTFFTDTKQDALTLTLCELQSADIKVPKECQSISTDPRIKSKDIKQCVRFVVLLYQHD